MESKLIRFKRQVKLSEELNEKGYNIVTCPSCGTVILVRKDMETIQCYECDTEDESSEFPDLYYDDATLDCIANKLIDICEEKSIHVLEVLEYIKWRDNNDC